MRGLTKVYEHTYKYKELTSKGINSNSNSNFPNSCQ